MKCDMGSKGTTDAFRQRSAVNEMVKALSGTKMV